jgi:hypothetical protein
MESSEMVVPSFSNDLPILHQDATDQRIGAHFPATPFSNEEGPFHEGPVIVAPHFVHKLANLLQFKTSCIQLNEKSDPKSTYYAV